MLLPIARTRRAPGPGGKTDCVHRELACGRTSDLSDSGPHTLAAMQTGAQPTGSQWTVAYQGTTLRATRARTRVPLKNGRSMCRASRNQMSLQCSRCASFRPTDLGEHSRKDKARAKAFLALRALARAGTAASPNDVFWQAMPGATFSHRILGGPSTSFAGTVGTRKLSACVISYSRAKLADSSPDAGSPRCRRGLK